MSDAPAKQHENQTENKLLHQKCEGHGALVKSFWMDRVVGMNSCLDWERNWRPQEKSHLYSFAIGGAGKWVNSLAELRGQEQF